jgi:hypothetical protein
VVDEIDAALRATATKKQSGPDGVPMDLIMILWDTLGFQDFLVRLYNAVRLLGGWPAEWKSGVMRPIPKGGTTAASAKDNRPIMLLNTLGKLMEAILLNRAWKYHASCDANRQDEIMPIEQAGFRRGGTSALAQAAMVTMIVGLNEQLGPRDQENNMRGRTLFGLNLDIAKAFDTIPHHKSYRSLQPLGYHGTPHVSCITTSKAATHA